jgi:DNA-directed RNA polymerase specialized sigma24 family protein
MVDHLRAVGSYTRAEIRRHREGRQTFLVAQLHAPARGEYDPTFYEPRTWDPEPADDPAAELLSAVRGLGVVLTCRERAALLAYHAAGRCQQDIARDLGISASRVSQVIGDAEDRIRDAILAAGRDWRTALS